MWGATADDVTKRLISAVSIHAPVWGATLVVIAVEPWRSFNPRTRVGCDLSAPILLVSMSAVSIHAPVWGATAKCCANKALLWFQSTHPCGVRLLHPNLSMNLVMFQSTHPCGVRLTRLILRFSLSSFNPRTRVGCDLLCCGFQYRLDGFNPRTRVGCDLNSLIKHSQQGVSIHAPVWGATAVFTTLKPLATFQSTHPCGVRPVERDDTVVVQVFQSTHPCGVRRCNGY